MEKFLVNFQQDEHTREAVRGFILKTLDKYALELIYERGDATHIADAKEVIETAFIELGELYDKQKDTPNVNKAR